MRELCFSFAVANYDTINSGYTSHRSTYELMSKSHIVYTVQYVSVALALFAQYSSHFILLICHYVSLEVLKNVLFSVLWIFFLYSEQWYIYIYIYMLCTYHRLRVKIKTCNKFCMAEIAHCWQTIQTSCWQALLQSQI